jgi:hypothetical protein
MPVYTYTTLDDPLASAGFSGGTGASGINDKGQIVGTYRNASGHHGYPPGTAVGRVSNSDVYNRGAYGRWSTQHHRSGGVCRAAGE